MAQALDVMYMNVETDGTQKYERFPALHKRWIETVEFIPYKAPPLGTEDRAAVEEWLEWSNYIYNDLDLLLRMPHQKFWCHAIFDSTLHQCIDSYLHLAPRSHDVVYNLSKEIKNMQENLHRLFFMTCLRMATHKESKETYITPAVFGEILYENFLFDIPKIMDICVLYGTDNSQLLNKMISNIFKQQPKYNDDLCATVPTLLHILETICQKCGVQLSSTGSPKKLAPGQSTKNLLISMALPEFQDVVFYVSDTAQTIWSFLEAYPNAAKILLERCGSEFAIKIANFYENVVPAITDAFSERTWDHGTQLKSLLMRTLHQAQVSYIKIFRQQIFHGCVQPLLESTSEEEVGKLIEEYMTIMTAVLSERRFLAHMNYLFPYLEDRDLISQSKYYIDETRLQFIQDAVNEASTLYIKNATIPPGKEMQQTKQKKRPENAEVNTQREFPSVEADEGACAPSVTGVNLQSLISSVQDLLPDLGEGFIEICLEELNYDIEKVINSVLEDKLPPSLQEIDKKMARDVAKVSAEVVEMESLLEKRLNIYDDDEFDAFRTKIDVTKVIKGKKERTSNNDLDDKSYIAGLKPLYDKYGSEQVESMYVPEDYDYDDEYDDTYDSNLVGADDADSADELTNNKRFMISQVHKKDLSGSRGEESDESEEDSSSEWKKHRNNFIEDPALIRQRKEEKRAATRQQFQSGSGGGARFKNKGASNAQKEYDVVGKAKGQGQEKDTVKNRAWKEKNKATRVHHNRKNLAAKKGGMF